MVLNAHAHQQNERKRTPFFRYRRREKEEEIEKRERKERKRCMIVCDNMDHNTPSPSRLFSLPTCEKNTNRSHTDDEKTDF
jgi:hypothetical protein